MMMSSKLKPASTIFVVLLASSRNSESDCASPLGCVRPIAITSFLSFDQFSNLNDCPLWDHDEVYSWMIGDFIFIALIDARDPTLTIMVPDGVSADFSTSITDGTVVVIHSDGDCQIVTGVTIVDIPFPRTLRIIAAHAEVLAKTYRITFTLVVVAISVNLGEQSLILRAGAAYGDYYANCTHDDDRRD